MLRMMMRRMFAYGGKERVLACREVTPRLSEFIDQELDSRMVGKIQDHLEVCTACRRFVDSLEKTSKLLGMEPSAAIPEDSAKDIMASLRKEYRDAVKELDDRASE